MWVLKELSYNREALLKAVNQKVINDKNHIKDIFLDFYFLE